MSEVKKRILMAGCGAIAKHWITYTLTRADCEIVGILEINPDNAREAMSRYGFSCPIYADLNQAITETKPDLVYDLTFVTTHSQIVTTSLELGCDVFGEKPMTLTRDEARRMLATADKTGHYYSLMQNRRYQKPVQAMKDFIAAGGLGELWMVRAEIYVGEDLKSIRNSLAKPMLQDNAIHTFDQARFISGEDAISVYCHSFNPPHSKYKNDAGGTCIFEMSRGTAFVYSCIMGMEGFRTSWEAEWRIMGSKGTLLWDGRTDPRAEILVMRDGNRYYEQLTPETSWKGQEQHYGCLDEMFAARAAGIYSVTDCRDNYKSISMVFSAIESAVSQRKERVK